MPSPRRDWSTSIGCPIRTPFTACVWAMSAPIVRRRSSPCRYWRRSSRRSMRTPTSWMPSSSPATSSTTPRPMRSRGVPRCWTGERSSRGAATRRSASGWDRARGIRGMSATGIPTAHRVPSHRTSRPPASAIRAFRGWSRRRDVPSSLQDSTCRGSAYRAITMRCCRAPWPQIRSCAPWPSVTGGSSDCHSVAARC